MNLTIEELRNHLLDNVDWSSVAAGHTCWEWLGAKCHDGYGSIYLNRKPIGTHRAAYHAFVGNIPKNICVCHHCDNPSCINPSHLWIGTRQDNERDKREKGRQVKGESVPQSKLTSDLVKRIRQNYVRYRKKCTIVAISKQYGLSTTSIRDVILRRTWKHIP